MQLLEVIVQDLLIGLANGSLIALVALGYTLVYGIVELINFAHGDVFMIGTMIALTLFTWVPSLYGVKQPYQLPAAMLWGLALAAFLASTVGCALLNVFIERVAYRRLRSAPRLAPLISAIGVSFILINVGLLWKGASQVNFPDILPRIDIFEDVLGVKTLMQFTVKDLLPIAVSVPLMVALTLFVNNTRLGKAMRATAQDRDAAAMMGININLTIALTFLIGGALAGGAGMVYGVYNNSAWYFQGFRNGLYAFTAAVLGGIGNIRGAYLGGMLIGVVASFSDNLGQILSYFPALSFLSFWDAKWTQAGVFGLLVLILIFKPTGLLGEEVTERA